jgi:putative glutamine amidotransferase
MRPLIGLTSTLTTTAGNPHGDRYGVSARYCEAIAAVGGNPILIPGLGNNEAVSEIFPLLDGLLFTGGPDIHPKRFDQDVHPGCEHIDEARDETELALIKFVKRSEIPVLGICRGIQLINVGFGGSLIQDIGSQTASTLNHRMSNPMPPSIAHNLSISPGSRFADIVGTDPLPANSLHHQAVDSVAPGFIATAWSEDGVIEAIERPGHQFLLAVQCHPEYLYANDYRWLRLFHTFVAEAGRVGVERRVRSA